ncbi:hypothetical protein JS533_007455 [Bifidobacterium amazonense]|uniref:Terminase small subunit n=1 Tax=Bifidobacterium amazonense TaxID=2809027 RepID=A0ABS9VVH6_9BIFI|nr:hypothetical protein [Bifidobacterium amazonense]MCH9276108.1 hypothetical protein [Bifidobacterium amazonense]
MVARTRKTVSKPAAKPSARKAHTLRNAANSGDRRRLLVAMRNLIADKLDEGKVSPRDLAALTKRLADLSNDIDAIDKAAAVNDPVAVALDVEDETFDDEPEH